MWFTDGAIRLTQFHCALTQHTQPETPNLILPLDAPKCHYDQTCLNQRPCFDGTGTAPCELTERSTVVWVEKEPATSLATSGPFNGHKTQSFTAGKTIHHLQQTYRAWTNSISHPSKLQFQPVILRPKKYFVDSWCMSLVHRSHPAQAAAIQVSLQEAAGQPGWARDGGLQLAEEAVGDLFWRLKIKTLWYERFNQLGLPDPYIEKYCGETGMYVQPFWRKLPMSIQEKVDFSHLSPRQRRH